MAERNKKQLKEIQEIPKRFKSSNSEIGTWWWVVSLFVRLFFVLCSKYFVLETKNAKNDRSAYILQEYQDYSFCFVSFFFAIKIYF